MVYAPVEKSIWVDLKVSCSISFINLPNFVGFYKAIGWC